MTAVTVNNRHLTIVFPGRGTADDLTSISFCSA